MVHGATDVRFDPAPLRAYDSLTQQHMAVVLQAVEAVSGAWQVDQHESYEGCLTILVTAADSDGEAPSFIVSGRLKHIELARIDGEDDLCECGCFSTIEEATAALVTAMVSTAQVTASMPGSKVWLHHDQIPTTRT